MAYRIDFTPGAARQFRKLPAEVRRRLEPVIQALADDPRPAGSKKLAGEERGYRVRMGDYRVLYRLEDDVLVVLVIRIGHRREVYRGA
ncbi:MAG: type II toxin-antitoxin system RelE family toxin [Deferrisomatales bacterium]